MGTGKKKIEIKKITKQLSRLVVFSKRRKGLFKKAQDLHATTSVVVTIVVFSLAGHCFTHSFGALADHYLTAIAATGYFTTWLNAIDVEAEDLVNLKLLRERLIETRYKLVSRMESEFVRLFLLN